MGSEKAWYWIAVGVLALLVSNNFAARHEGEIRGLASRSLNILEQVSGPATHLMARAEMVLERGGGRFAQAQATLARAQSRMASVQATIACREAAFARLQAEHDRLAAIQELRGAVFCPRQNLRIVIPRMPAMRTDGTI
jgi:hypothetical protein